MFHQRDMFHRSTSHLWLDSSRFHVCLLFVLVMVLDSATVAFSSWSLDQASFIVVNLIETQPAAIHIKCGNRHHGAVIQRTELIFREHVTHEFKPSFWGKSWYSCEFTWESPSWRRTAAFKVWTDNYFLEFWQKRPCNTCTWTVTADGFTEYDGSGQVGMVVTEHRWIAERRR